MIWTLVVMWTAIGISSILVTAGHNPRPVLAAAIGVAGLIGTFFIIRLGSKTV